MEEIGRVPLRRSMPQSIARICTKKKEEKGKPAIYKYRHTPKKKEEERKEDILLGPALPQPRGSSKDARVVPGVGLFKDAPDIGSSISVSILGGASSDHLRP